MSTSIVVGPDSEFLKLILAQNKTAKEGKKKRSLRHKHMIYRMVDTHRRHAY
jgi:hypothetical protein